MQTTVVGSYPRIGGKPPTLRAALHRYDRGEITEKELGSVADRVTDEVLSEQAEAGVDLVTDGQVRWEDGQTYFAQRIAGFGINGLVRYFDNNAYFRQPEVEGKLQRRGPISVRDFKFAVEHSQKPVKPVVTGPYTLARLSAVGGGYPDIASVARDLAGILNDEALALEEAGATIIQFDEPAILKHPEDLHLFGELSRRLVRSLGTRTAVYTYFRDAMAVSDGLFDTPFDVIGLDFASGPRNWELVRDFPIDKGLGFGVLDARNTKLEAVENLVDAIRRVTSHVSSDRLYVNPSAGLEYLPRDNARQKVRRMVEGVRKAREVVDA